MHNPCFFQTRQCILISFILKVNTVIVYSVDPVHAAEAEHPGKFRPADQIKGFQRIQRCILVSQYNFQIGESKIISMKNI